MTDNNINNNIDLSGTVYLADIVTESVVDGSGIRFTIFTQGCPHRCEGCHNPSTHPIGQHGVDFEISKMAEMIESNPLLSGITLSGGEPFLQPEPLAKICKFVHSKNMNVWCYTGYTLEDLTEKAKTDENIKNLLNGIDVLVDGKFILSQKDALLVFKGSKNQRIINLKAMRQQNTDKIITLEF